MPNKEEEVGVTIACNDTEQLDRLRNADHRYFARLLILSHLTRKANGTSLTDLLSLAIVG